uniref:Transcription factor AP-2 C-terminal domain-containing protein n=1 Tax=Setaria digitata TaxID=48799 RepID=A0A915PIR8_9BILA
MLPSSHRQASGTTLLGRQIAGAQIDRIGTLLLEKKSLERKRPSSTEVYDNSHSVICSKRAKTVKETLFNLLPVLSAQNSCKSVGNESKLIPFDSVTSRNFGKSSPAPLSSNESTGDECNEDLGDSGSISNSSVLLTNISPSTSIQTFCSVPGRLSLLCASSKYKVSVAELARRLSPPESLNASLLGGILRRAKSKNGGQTLRDQLERIGLKLPAGRRKSTNVTLLTSLVEGEAQHLAKDFANACSNEFPAKSIAQSRLKKCDTMSVMELEKEKEKFRAAKQLLSGFMDMLRQDSSVLFSDKKDVVMQNSMERFSLITHTFGTPAILAGLSTFLMYVQESLDILSHQSTVTEFQVDNFIGSSILCSQQINGIRLNDGTKKFDNRK